MVSNRTPSMVTSITVLIGRGSREEESNEWDQEHFLPATLFIPAMSKITMFLL